MNAQQLRQLARILDRFPWLPADYADSRPRDEDGRLLYREGSQCPRCSGQHTHGGPWSGPRVGHCAGRISAAVTELRRLGQNDLAAKLEAADDLTYILVPAA